MIKIVPAKSGHLVLVTGYWLLFVMKSKIICIKNWCVMHRIKFAKYFVVGFSGMILDVGLLYLASDIFMVRPFYAIFVTQIVVIVYNFLLNKYWSFQSRGRHARQLFRFGIVLGGNYLFAAAAMYVGNDMMGVNHLLVRVLTIALAVAWNFLLYNYWVYRE